MKIINVQPITVQIVEMEDGEWTTYQRSPSGDWLVLMGESWESCYSQEEELEAAYQKYMAGENG